MIIHKHSHEEAALKKICTNGFFFACLLLYHSSPLLSTMYINHTYIQEIESSDENLMISFFQRVIIYSEYIFITNYCSKLSYTTRPNTRLSIIYLFYMWTIDKSKPYTVNELVTKCTPPGITQCKKSDVQHKINILGVTAAYY